MRRARMRDDVSVLETDTMNCSPQGVIGDNESTGYIVSGLAVPSITTSWQTC